ncbi:hypothetical protein RB595_008566 [Gaeumannomyces hyphopodioides]
MGDAKFAAAYSNHQAKNNYAEKWETTIDATNLTTRPLAAQLLGQMGLDSTRDKPFRLLDHACGAGVVGNLLHASVAPEVLEKSSILSADLAPGMVELVKDRQVREGWINSEAQVLDAQKTDLPDASLSHITIGMALHITPEPQLVLKDCIRLLQPGGVVGLSTPTGAMGGHMQDLRAAFASFPFDAPFPDPFPTQLHGVGRWADANWVARNLSDEHGLGDVRVELHAHLARYRDGAEFARLFSPFLPVILNGWWPEETRRAHPVDEVLGLVAAFLDDKYEGRPWYSEFYALVASGQKKSE